MINKNYYERFGLKEKASDTEIKKAYRKLALKYHPDKNEGDPKFDNIFKQINQIYETLSNPTSRQVYDDILKKERAENIATNYYKQPTNTQQREYTYSRADKTSYTAYKEEVKSDFGIPLGVTNFFRSIISWGIFIALIALLGALGDWIFGSSKISSQRKAETTSSKDEASDSGLQTGDIKFNTGNTNLNLATDTIVKYQKISKPKNKLKPGSEKEGSQPPTGDIKF